MRKGFGENLSVWQVFKYSYFSVFSANATALKAEALLLLKTSTMPNCAAVVC